MKKVFGILILSLYVGRVTSQTNYRFENISTEQGLYYNMIKAIVQDQYGFIWVATTYGLNRFDGYKLKDYTYDPNKSGSLKESVVTSLFFDDDKKLWVVGDNFNVYDNKADTFIQFKSSFISCTKLTQDNHKNFWFLCGNKGIHTFNTKSRTYDVIDLEENSLPNAGFKANIIIDEKNYLWYLTSVMGNSVIYRFSLDDYYKLKKIKPELITSSKNVRMIYKDKKNNIWTCIENQLMCFNSANQKFEHFITIDMINPDEWGLVSVCRDSKNNLWLGLSNFRGLICINLDSKEVQHIPSDNPGKNNLYANIINTIFEDIYGVLWVGTEKHGLYKTNLKTKKFDYINTSNGLADNCVSSIVEDHHKNIYYGSTKGLTVIDTHGHSRSYAHNQEKLPHIFAVNNFHSLVELDNNTIIAGGTGISIANLEKKHFYYVHPDTSSSSLCGWTIWNIHKGQRSGNYWVSTSFGVNEIFDFNLPEPVVNKSVRAYPKMKSYNQDKNCPLYNKLTWCAYEDRDGIVWFGTNMGLVRYTAPINKFNEYPVEYGKQGSLNSRDVTCICEDRNKRLWLGTMGGGINLFNKKTASFKAFTKADGLPSNHVFGIVEDNKGMLWVSTNKGLCKFNPDDHTVHCYGEPEGLQGYAFNQFAYFKNTEGKLYFGGLNGVNSFYPDSIISNPIQPSIVFTQLLIGHKIVHIGEKINGDIVLKNSLLDADQIKIKHANNQFSLEFAAIHTVAPDKTRYFYMLEGFDKDWIATNAQYRLAHYNNIPAGKYIFKVKACNSDGIWSKVDHSSLLIRVYPPFYKTWWFILLCSIIAFILGRAYVRFRIANA